METALSLKEAGVKGTILAAGGIHNIKNYKGSAEKIIIAADHDAEGSPARQTIDQTVRHFKEQGKDVKTLMPKIEGQDFNDVLKEKGVEGVKGTLGVFQEVETASTHSTACRSSEKKEKDLTGMRI